MNKEKIRCKDCEYCKCIGGLRATRGEFFCEHPDYEYIDEYFRRKRMAKMPRFLGFGKPYSKEVPIKTSPAWCPLKREEDASE